MEPVNRPKTSYVHWMNRKNEIYTYFQTTTYRPFKKERTIFLSQINIRSTLLSVVGSIKFVFPQIISLNSPMFWWLSQPPSFHFRLIRMESPTDDRKSLSPSMSLTSSDVTTSVHRHLVLPTESTIKDLRWCVRTQTRREGRRSRTSSWRVTTLAWV